MKLSGVTGCDTVPEATELTTKRKSLADRGIVEAKLGRYYFLQGKLDDAKSQWLNSLSDGVAVSNLVLQSDVLVALSALSQQGGDLDQSLKGANQAVDLAKKSKSLYILSRALGELSRLHLLAGKTVDARASLEEALQIDRLNGYEWEAGHLLSCHGSPGDRLMVDGVLPIHFPSTFMENPNWPLTISRSTNASTMLRQSRNDEVGLSMKLPQAMSFLPYGHGATRKPAA